MLKSLVLALVFVRLLGAQDFVFVNGVEPKSLDPARIAGAYESRICSALFEGLIVRNARTSKGEPGLAESYRVSRDGRTYTFRLRPASWSDGTPIKAQAVVDSWLRTLDPHTGSDFAQMIYDHLEGAKAYYQGKAGREAVGVRALDDRTLEATFVSPMPYVVDMLAHPAWWVVPMHVIAQYGEAWTQPGHLVGNGAFVLKEWRPQDRIVVARNERYWDARNVKLRTITFLPIDDAAVAYDKYKAGEVDWVGILDPNRIDEIRLRPDYHQNPSSTIYYYVFNTKRPPFDQAAVRKAFSLATDRKTLVEQVLRGGQVATGGLVPAFGSFRTTPGNLFAPDKARDLLASAGYAVPGRPGGKAFPPFEIIYNTDGVNKKIAEWVQQQWKTSLGVDVSLRNLEWNTFMDVCTRTHDFQVASAAWGADFPDPINFLGELLKTGSPNNSGQFSDPKADALIEKANRMAGGAARDRVLMEAEHQLITEEQALLPFFFRVNQNLIDTRKWGGWYENPMNVHPWKSIFPLR